MEDVEELLPFKGGRCLCVFDEEKGKECVEE